jgi:hypothetical protein
MGPNPVLCHRADGPEILCWCFVIAYEWSCAALMHLLIHRSPSIRTCDPVLDEKPKGCLVLEESEGTPDTERVEGNVLLLAKKKCAYVYQR